ncbi:hypothetical protein [Meiothermus hypogaeus]|uniref:hypothetical protein n=1 Tax=Meiothermus hypogaeus TaxID=884155 RepID=UPI0011BF6A14|nr:hypothetical protein [Meiothermus hypogaeus]
MGSILEACSRHTSIRRAFIVFPIPLPTMGDGGDAARLFDIHLLPAAWNTPSNNPMQRSLYRIQKDSSQNQKKP